MRSWAAPRRRFPLAIIVLGLLLAPVASAQPAPNARPTGGVILGGQASISQTVNNTVVSQTTQRAAVSWQSYDVGSQHTMTVQAPNAQAITLMIVRAPNPSQIAGRINSNGQIILVNQSGATFDKGAQVNVAGLVVSSPAADPAKFMAGGKIAFAQPGKPNAAIVNSGALTASGAGMLTMIAPSVRNAGTVNAKLGHVFLLGAKTATMNLFGDRLIAANITGAVTQAPDGATALVSQAGMVTTAGGSIQLAARAVDGIVTTLVSDTGTLTAPTAGSRAGTITLDGVGGSLSADGTLTALGAAAGDRGGRIGLLASADVTLGASANLRTSGLAGGGTIALGTTLKRAAGGPSVTSPRESKNLTVPSGAVVSANATRNGNGGHITMLSAARTAFAGSAAARGGPNGGNGGQIEISGNTLVLTGTTDVSAPHGTPGTILLDPHTLIL